MTTPATKVHTPTAEVTQNNAHTPAIMSPLVDGSAPTYSATKRNYYPSPNLATLIFHAQGAFPTGTSPPLHSRYPCCVFQVVADLGTFASAMHFELLLNGESIASFPMTSPSSRLLLVDIPAMQPYSDLLSVHVTDAGTGNADLVVHVELVGSNKGEA